MNNEDDAHNYQLHYKGEQGSLLNDLGYLVEQPQQYGQVDNPVYSQYSHSTTKYLNPDHSITTHTSNTTKKLQIDVTPLSSSSPAVTTLCPVCQDPVDETSYVEASNMWYHPECFVCFQCLEPFTGEQFYTHVLDVPRCRPSNDQVPPLSPTSPTQRQNGRQHQEVLLCEFDYTLLYGSRCMRCGEIITGKCITALDAKWHPDHFSCEMCGKSLAGTPFIKKNGRPYCKQCNTKLKSKEQMKKAAEICERCKKDLHPFEKIVFQGVSYHAYHFTCTACKETLSASNCKEHESRLYCVRDYERVSSTAKNICFGCRKVIVGRSVDALGKYFHPEHFVCSKCEKPFVGETFWQHNQKPYCEYHYNEMIGAVCAFCYEPATGGTGVIEAINQKWCQHHLTCVGCHADLIEHKSKFADWDCKPLCKKCWDSLPLDIRKSLNRYLKIDKMVLEKANTNESKEELK